MRHFFWVVGNIYGYLFGRAFFAPLHHALMNLSLHGLGYDNMFRDAWTGEMWFVKKVLAPSNPKVILDIGANIGNYSRMLLTHTGARVYAVEPSPTSYAELQKLQGSDKRMTAINVAISDRDGEATLYSKEAHDGRASLDRSVRQGRGDTVRTMTVESLVRGRGIAEVDFIKVDVEGYEREVFRGLGTIRPRFIQFEFNLHHLQRSCTFFDLAALLPEYEFYRLLPHGWLKVQPGKYLDNIFMFSNIVARKKE